MATRILFLYPTLAVGGAERQLALLVPRLVQHGFEPIVATLSGRGRHFDELRTDVSTVHLAMSSRVDVRAMVRALRLTRIEPQIVFTQGMNAQLLGSAIALRARVPHITADHGGAGFDRGRHRVLLTRLVARSADRVVCVSGTQIPGLLELGYSRDAIAVIPNGVPEPQPELPRAESRLRLGLDDDDVVVLLVAMLRPEKRADLFVEAVTRAHARDARVRGLVVGGGPQLAKIVARAEMTGGVVQALGERTDVAALMASADAVCLTSDVEAAPLTVLEAMAAGRPIVATAVGGLADLVRPGETGSLVPRGDPQAFADAIVELAADPARRMRMGANARARFERHYTFGRMVERYASLLTDVAARAGT